MTTMRYRVDHLSFGTTMPVCSNEPDIEQAKNWGQEYAEMVLDYTRHLDWRQISDTLWVLTHGGTGTDVLLTAVGEPAPPRPEVLLPLPK
jgi:hypothetical protein